MRLFIAVNLSSEIKQSIRDALDRFPISDPPWRWVKDDALHITLKFLGETPEERIPAIIAHIEKACIGHRRFRIRLAHLGGFPNLNKPRVLFYQVVEGGQTLAGLAGDIDRSLAEGLGVAGEKRPFRAHVTVARIKRPLPREITSRFAEAPVLASADQSVCSVDLMRSELHREGARYSPVKEIALNVPA